MALRTGIRRLLPLACSLAAAANASDVLQFGYDSGHSGNNTAESLLGPANVAGLQQVYVTAFSGTDGPPVFLGGVATGAGTKDLLFATTVYGVAALDAASGVPVWIQSPTSFEYSLGTSPAIDPNRQFVYGPGSDGRLHKLAVGDGAEVVDANWPVVSSRKPAIEKANSPLSIGGANGAYFLYSVTSSFNDADDYQGHLTAVDLATGQSQVFNAVCSDLHVHFIAHGTPGVDDCAQRLAGIWNRAGVTFDAATKRIFFTTGNGVFDGNTGGHDWGDSVIALKPDGGDAGNGRPLDSFTPHEYPDLEIFDRDLGATSPVVLPPVPGSAIAHLGVQLGKDAVVRLLDLGNLSRSGGAGFVGGELQSLALAPGSPGEFGTAQPAAWTDVHGDGAVWVFASARGALAGLRVMVSNGQPFLEQQWLRAAMSTTSPPTVANGVVYAATQGSNGAAIAALEPSTGTPLWTSPPIERCCHAQGPIVVDGRLYLASGAVVTMFALPDAQAPPSPGHASMAAAKPALRPATALRPIP
jgi:outer membrane protein assembly factor BamB